MTPVFAAQIEDVRFQIHQGEMSDSDSFGAISPIENHRFEKKPLRSKIGKSGEREDGEFSVAGNDGEEWRCWQCAAAAAGDQRRPSHCPELSSQRPQP